MVGDDFYLVDGHHRLAAYVVASSPERTSIPVVYFEGDVIAARKEALRLNSTGKLSLSFSELRDSAFELVKQGSSEEEVHSLTRVSRPTCFNMKKKLREFPETTDMAWRVAKGYSGKKDSVYNSAEPYENPKSREIEAYLRKILPASSSAVPVLAAALEHLSPHLPSELIAYWTDSKSPGYNKRHRDVTAYVADVERDFEDD